MAEENQVKQGPTEPQHTQRVMKEPQRVTTKDPKKVEAGKGFAAINHKKREAKKREEQAQLERTASGVNQYYGMGSLCDPGPAGPIGALIALGVIGSLGYYIYQTKKGPANREVMMPVSQQPRPQVIAVQVQTNKFEMD